MLVYLQSNYSYPDLLRQTPGEKGEWDDLKFTTSDIAQSDLIVVFNHPIRDIKMRCRKGGKILITQEPPYEAKKFLTGHFKYYDKIISAFSGEQKDKIFSIPAGLPWHVNKTYDELKALRPGQKADRISWVTSNQNKCEEHQVRLDFVDFLKSKNVDFDLFGRGFQPIADKFDGIFPYKYSIAAENYISDDYFTEKIIDPFLSYTMPIYYGCRNIEKYFPKEAMIIVDLRKQEEAYHIIMKAIENKAWEKNLDAITAARNLVLDKYQFFPMIRQFINMNCKDVHTAPFENVFLAQDGLTKVERLKRKLKYRFLKS
jgi:hypothetical protein